MLLWWVCWKFLLKSTKHGWLLWLIPVQIQTLFWYKLVSLKLSCELILTFHWHLLSLQHLLPSLLHYWVTVFKILNTWFGKSRVRLPHARRTSWKFIWIVISKGHFNVLRICVRDLLLSVLFLQMDLGNRLLHMNGLWLLSWLILRIYALFWTVMRTRIWGLSGIVGFQELGQRLLWLKLSAGITDWRRRWMMCTWSII